MNHNQALQLPLANSLLTLLALKGLGAADLQGLCSPSAQLDLAGLTKNLSELIGNLESCDSVQQRDCYKQCVSLLNDDREKQSNEFTFTASMALRLKRIVTPPNRTPPVTSPLLFQSPTKKARGGPQPKPRAQQPPKPPNHPPLPPDTPLPPPPPPAPPTFGTAVGVRLSEIYDHLPS